MKKTAIALALGFLSGLSLGAVIPRSVTSGLSPVVVGIGSQPPPVCLAGSMWIDTDEADDTNCATTADNSLCVCYSDNTWDTTE